jgi:23S rRNA pseudoU1915 N3-methylase RlmH
MEGMMAVVTNSKNDVVTTVLGTVQGLQMLVLKKNQLSLSLSSLFLCAKTMIVVAMSSIIKALVQELKHVAAKCLRIGGL